MSISRRTAVAVRTLGVAAVASAVSLGFAGSAFACNIADFHASAACDSSNGTATITVVDDDSSGHTAQLQLFDGTTQIGGTETVVGGPQSSPGQATFSNVPWKTSGGWTLTVNVQGYIDNDQISVPAAGTACSGPTTSKPTPPASATPTPTPSASASGSRKPTPPASGTPSASASPVGSVSAVASASPTGPALAETGGGNDSGLIAGVAGALVVAGGGVVFALRRRGAARH